MLERAHIGDDCHIAVVEETLHTRHLRVKSERGAAQGADTMVCMCRAGSGAHIVAISRGIMFGKYHPRSICAAFECDTDKRFVIFRRGAFASRQKR